MSDNQTEDTTDETTEDTADTATPEGTESDPQPTDPGAEAEGGSREAAKYRTRLRQTEAERDDLRTQLAQMQTAIDRLRSADAERIAQTHGLTPAALWASGATLADLQTDDGTIDPAKIAAAATTAKDLFGLRPPAPDATGLGKVGQPIPVSTDTGDTWRGAFEPKAS